MVAAWRAAFTRRSMRRDFGRAPARFAGLLPRQLVLEAVAVEAPPFVSEDVARMRLDPLLRGSLFRLFPCRHGSPPPADDGGTRKAARGVRPPRCPVQLSKNARDHAADMGGG